YLDDDHGNGLSIGVEYCYFITAVYPGGSESCATEQVCASLKKDLPVITNVDVRETNVSQGSIYVAWSKPEELDTILFPGPYQYRLHHSTGFFGTALSQIAVMNDLNDTTYIDTLINTQNNAWSYRVELYYTNNGNLTLKGSSTVASSVFLSIAPSDNRMILSWEEHVPWTNYSYDIFKLNDVTAQYDSITTTTFKTFTDTGLANGVTYCYFIRSVGEYSFPGFIDPIVNRSQRACGVPIDNIVPCSPDLSVQSFCLDDLNKLTWTNPNNFCADDVLKYYIYFASTKDGNYERIDSILSPTDTIYFHTDLSSLAGCYKVTAIDSVGNETLVPEQVCVDTCRQYVLPSVFTPNGDKRNDLFHPCDETTAQALQEKNCPAYKNVKDIAIKIYNRWGTLVFETTDKDINWDGREQKSGKECPEGVYYYTCIVNFYRVGGVEPFELKGYVHLLRSK
ncbi:MAG TPA: gliding motility-associated C-terminal domain-containing protein, partial [Bacteroidia bacterium]|nr:gliding motility-associated C-terminal domain-containing protein [Bacteroidia bacterium]